MVLGYGKNPKGGLQVNEVRGVLLRGHHVGRRCGDMGGEEAGGHLLEGSGASQTGGLLHSGW